MLMLGGVQEKMDPQKIIELQKQREQLLEQLNQDEVKSGEIVPTKTILYTLAFCAIGCNAEIF